MKSEQCDIPEQGWTRIAYLNSMTLTLSDPDHSCPTQWRFIGSRDLCMCCRSHRDQNTEAYNDPRQEDVAP
jgi:hypothetical protein